MRADQVLPDDVNQLDLAGTTVRKGTIAAFLANARVWCDPDASEAARTSAANDIVDLLPALHAIRIFETLEIRDPALRAWIARLPADATASRAATQARS